MTPMRSLLHGSVVTLSMISIACSGPGALPTGPEFPTVETGEGMSASAPATAVALGTYQLTLTVKGPAGKNGAIVPVGNGPAFPACAIGQTCTAALPAGSKLQLGAKTSGSRRATFYAWAGPCDLGNQATQCQITLGTDTFIEATFR